MFIGVNWCEIPRRIYAWSDDAVRSLLRSLVILLTVILVTPGDFVIFRFLPLLLDDLRRLRVRRYRMRIVAGFSHGGLREQLALIVPIVRCTARLVIRMPVSCG